MIIAFIFMFNTKMIISVGIATTCKILRLRIIKEQNEDLFSVNWQCCFRHLALKKVEWKYYCGIARSTDGCVKCTKWILLMS